MEKISILGAGGWGTALAIHLHKKGYKILLWEVFPEYAEELKDRRENYKFLPGIKIPQEIKITHSLKEAIEKSTILVVAIPSRYLRNILKKIPPIPQNCILVSVVKGIEEATGKRMSEIIEEECGKLKVAVLSGPSHAEEVARFIPTAAVVSSSYPEVAEKVQKIFISPYFRIYTNPDVIGVEIGGALKNIIAIACGISDGLGFGDNTKAAIMTRGLAEIVRLGVALGGKPYTFWGLSGMGDMIVTCTSHHSRNRAVGERIGKGENLKEILSSMEKVAEGIFTVKSARELAYKVNVEMPITEVVYQILYEGMSPEEGVKSLMLRTPREEPERFYGK